MKKLELHFDAALVIGLVFAVAVGFIALQWSQNSTLAQSNVDLQLKLVMLEVQQARLEAVEKDCAAPKR